jgi:basic amino acid/polyamine antiporter, APA family
MTEPTEQRPFGFWTATAMVVGTMIGAGIFVLPAQLAPFGWNGAAAWLIAGAGGMVIAAVLAALTRARPAQPNVVAICGEVLGAPTGIMLGWSFWISVWTSIAVVATSAARYLATLYPPAGATQMRVAWFGAAIIVVLSLNSLRGARGVGRVQVAATVLKLLPLVVVLGLLAWLALTGTEPDHATGLAPLEPAQITPALGLAFFAVIGFECATMVTERVRDPARNMSRALIFGVAGTTLLYLVLCTGMALAVPSTQLAASTTPVAWFVETFLGHGAGLVIAMFAGIAGIGYINGTTYVLGELPLGAVRAGLLPSWLARTNRRDVAYAPLLTGSALALALMFVAAQRTDVLDFMLRLTTTSTMWLYMGAALAALKLGIRRVLAVVSIVFSAWVLYGVGMEANLLGLALIAMGLPLWFLTARAASSAAAS